MVKTALFGALAAALSLLLGSAVLSGCRATAATPAAPRRPGVVRFDDACHRPDPAADVATARCDDGLLAVTLTDGATTPRGLGRTGDYHSLDYALFHMSVRRNVGARVRSFFAAQDAR